MSISCLLISIDEERVVAVLQQAADILDRAQGEAILDFSCLRRIDSAGVQALENLARIADEKAVKLVLRAVNVDVYKVLKLLKLTQRFSFVN